MNRSAAIVAAGWPIGPWPSGCLCGAAAHLHAGELHAGPGPDGCPAYRPDPAWDLAWAVLAADERLAMDDVATHNTAARGERAAGRWQVSPSDVGSCPRQVWYREAPPDGYEPLPDDTRQADAGTAMHAGITEARAALYPWREHKVRVHIPGLDRGGEADEYDPVTATVEDWKTAGKATWDHIGVYGPWEKAWKQSFIYAYALAVAGRPVRRVRIRYIHRETGVEETFTRPYDESYALGALGELVNLVTMMEAGLEPIRAGRGPDVDPLCDRCPARAHCWAISAAKVAGLTPQTYTVHGPNPTADDPQVVWAVEEAGRARLERLDREKDEKAYKALADVPEGTYGTFEVKRGSTRRSQHKEAFEQLVDRLEDWAATPEDERPPLLSIVPNVRVKRFPTLEIVPVRKASTEKPVPVHAARAVAEALHQARVEAEVRP
ncbi:hypothetical protein ABZ671_18505 [Micromonospora sp. NPDC006766]|uniref:hypothetical protein n=1 Tax=Micromonospora sp. NPDC006766 TaxID=3154778 RepID=UPI0033E78717